jgi:hypothetical protein
VIAFKRGASRHVLVCHSIALKFARSKWGARCNLYEANVFKSTTACRRKMLCPVLWCSAKGAILVMRAAAPMSEEDFDRLDRTGELPDWKRIPYSEDITPFESKAADWGWLGGKPVVLDYAADPGLFDGE